MKDNLRYRISNWDQLTECKSNNSTDLYITVDHVFNDKRLSGIIVRINHSDFGTLFACTLNAKGTILTPDNNSGIISEFDTDSILKELYKFGFEVTFALENNLPGNQLDYLITINNLGFDKLRKISVYEYDSNANRHYTDYIVVFDVNKCPKWIDADYTTSKLEFLSALNGGGAMNLTYISVSNQFDWTWLTYVASIDDILRNNQSDEGSSDE